MRNTGFVFQLTIESVYQYTFYATLKRQKMKFFAKILKWTYRRLPLSFSQRNKLKIFIENNFSFIARIARGYGWKTSSSLSKLNNLKLQSTEDVIAFQSNEPVVSIIIPVYGKIDYTLTCLRSLAAYQKSTELNFEIIVVDDNSPDDTCEVVGKLDGINLVKNASNVGFIESCNMGASVANGEFLLFLNNDTEVLRGWLDELYRCLVSDSTIGLVGSKLIYPNGMLQEAGGIIWDDGTGWNYGRLDDPWEPKYNYIREVDYCSGASIMVRKNDFEAVGGFDLRYKPAYFEDADLAFKMRSIGKKVVYNPFSELVHYEGVTSGKDITSGVKSYQVKNHEKFIRKWRSELLTQYPQGKEVLRARERGYRKQILIIDACNPMPDKDAGSVTAFYFQKILSEAGIKVTFIPENLAYEEKYTQGLQREGIEVIYGPYVHRVESYLKANGSLYDYVLLYRAHTAARFINAITKYCNRAKVIFDTVDLHYLRVERQAELEKSRVLQKMAIRTKKSELGVIEKADMTLVLSDAEKSVLESEGYVEKVKVMPLVLDVPGCRNMFRNRNGLIFIGGFSHQPNIDAVKYFTEEIWPVTKKLLPDLKFTVIGSNPPDEIVNLEDDDINIVGYVECLDEYFDNAVLSIAPLRYGAGIKGKIGTSLSFGVPVVSTQIGVEGMGLENEMNILIADEPIEFANSIKRLCTNENLWNKLSENGLEFVRNNYSIETCKRRLLNLLNEVDG